MAKTLLLGTLLGTLLAAKVAVAAGGAASCPAEIRDGDIVYIGDSISVSPYSDEIARTINDSAQGYRMDRYAVAGSAAVHWQRGFSAPFFRHTNTLCDSRAGFTRMQVPGQEVPSFGQLKAAAKPRAVVIALGTNDINNYCATVKQGGKPGPSDMWMTGARELVAALPAGANCVWVSPLTYTAGTIAEACSSLPGGIAGAINLLRAQVGSRCHFVNSSEACPLPLKFDNVGVHPIGQSARDLGACIGVQVKSLLGKEPPAHPPAQGLPEKQGCFVAP